MVTHEREFNILGQPIIGSIYDETGTSGSGYQERGPYSCKDCVHKIAHDLPFCIHPKVLADPELQDRIVMIDNRPTVKINMERGCCRYVRPPVQPKAEVKHDEKEEEHEVAAQE